jgi:hypothetical protein
MYKEENIKPNFLKGPGTNPFHTPESYFDSLEDEVMKKIRLQVKKKSTSGKILRILKPVVGIAACLTLVYLLTNYPLGKNSKNNHDSELTSTVTLLHEEDSTLILSLIDEITLINAIFEEEKSPASDINPDEMLAYLSSQLNVVEICSEFQN